MSKYITELAVSIDTNEAEGLLKRGFKKIPIDLMQDKHDYSIYLWYKKGDSAAITKVQLTYMENMQSGLSKLKYTRIESDLSGGTNKNPVNLWYFKGTTHADVPIVEVEVSIDPENEAMMFSRGWERLACDLTLTNKETKVYLWMKRETPTFIQDIDATGDYSRDVGLLELGYTRVDLIVNTGKEGAPIFIWYLLTTDSSKAVKDIKVSNNKADEEYYVNQDYIRVRLDLNQWCCWDPEYLWYKKISPKDPIKIVTMIPSSSTAVYEREAATVIKKMLCRCNYLLSFHR